MSYRGMVSRRRFFQSAAAVAALGSGLPRWFIERTADAREAKPPKSANDKPNVALVGCGGQGRGDARWASQFGNIVAVCDLDEKRAAAASQQFNGAKIYHDFRKLMDRDDIPIIITATPDHWHTLVNIHAIRRDKDIYSEKPLTLTINEGEHVVEEVKKHGRIFQTGSQQRSDARFRLACELVRNNRIGKLKEVVVILPAGPRQGPFAPAPVPPELDWDFWLGQTPKVEYVPQRCHGTFRYWYDYSGGTMTDWGAHHNDIALWGMGMDRSGPVTIDGKQLIDPIPGGYTAASEYHIIYTYKNGVVHHCRSTTNNRGDGSMVERTPDRDRQHGVTFKGADGWIWVTRGKIEASKPELLKEPLPENAVKLYASNSHMGNFFECVRTRQPAIAEAEIGHRSVSVCHLGVLSMRLGRKLNWDPDAQKFANDPEADKWLSRPMRSPWSYEVV